ncbi:thiol reductant ABC exporter subunit CydC [Zhihengliuella flava]|uniref:ATP-binding cassette subfamily C protein CydCD n=1 Tax=Zhihengliuella flava TaxID=1285193 RepID=A0A931D8N1_9MICC|nr:thiol reductant ABC exporter subunit CydC [Zhihengliuella flava]MBG6085675.1 ATP-binding cassette subfamily C protein CydCD [Zhihengliuella flava]
MKPLEPLLTAGVRGTRTYLTLLAVCGLVKAVGVIMVAEALAVAIAQLAANAPLDAHRLLVVGGAGAAARGLASAGMSLVSRRLGAGTKEVLRTRLLRRSFASTRADDGEVATLATRGLDGLDAYVSTYLPALMTAAVVPIVVWVRIAAADWVSALIVALTVPLVPLFMVLIGLHTQDRINAAADSAARLTGSLTELAQGLPALLGVRRAQRGGHALAAATERSREATMRTLRTALMSSLALELIATISVAVVAVFVGIRLVHGDMALAAGLLALILAPECYLPLRDVGSAFHASEDGAEAFRRVRARTTGEAAPAGSGDRGDAVRQPTGAGERKRRRGEVLLAVDHLTVEADGRTIAGPLTLRLGPSQVRVLDGASGTGKTSLLTELVRTSPEPVVWIPQHPVTTESTVTAELELYAGNAVPPAAVASALSAVGLDVRPTTDPASLSPGELRRLAVARALVRIRLGAPVGVVLADEPTAHLDADAAAAVRTCLEEIISTRAAVIATHDPLLAQRLRGANRGAGSGESAGESAPGPDRGREEKRSRAPQTAIRARGSVQKVAATLPTRRLAVALLVGAVAGLFAVALTGVSGWLIVSASYQPPMLHLMVAIVGVRFFGLGRSCLRYLEQLLVHDALLRWSATIRWRLWDALVTQPRWWKQMTRGSGALALLVTRVDEVRDQLPRVVAPFAVAVAVVLGVCVALAVWAPSAVPVGLTVAFVGLVLVPMFVVWADSGAAAAEAEHRAWLASRVPALLRAAPQLRGNGAAHRALAEFERHDVQASRRLIKTARGVALATAVAAAVSSLGAVAVLLLAPIGVDARHAAMSALLVLALAEPLTSAALAAQRVRPLAKSLQSVGDVLPDPRTDARVSRTAASDAGPTGSVEGLRVRSLTAGWEPGRPVLSNLSLQVHRGEVAALTGPSGAGKSTALAVLMGALAPEQGYLEVRRGDRWEPFAATDADRVAWCPQEAYLFDSTVARNLGLGRDAQTDPVTEREMLAALDAVGLGPWLAAQPLGLQARIGAGGHTLSGGERQRLAVARALLTRADVVLLDEPTAHLGADEAVSVMRDVRSALARRAVVLVTHDPALVDSRETHVRLEAGAVDPVAASP